MLCLPKLPLWGILGWTDRQADSCRAAVSSDSTPILGICAVQLGHQPGGTTLGHAARGQWHLQRMA